MTSQAKFHECSYLRMPDGRKPATSQTEDSKGPLASSSLQFHPVIQQPEQTSKLKAIGSKWAHRALHGECCREACSGNLETIGEKHQAHRADLRRLPEAMMGWVLQNRWYFLKWGCCHQRLQWCAWISGINEVGVLETRSWVCGMQRTWSVFHPVLGAQGNSLIKKW